MIVEKLKQQQIIIYGMGANGRYAYQYLTAIGIGIECFSDKDGDKCRSGYEGIICKNINDISQKEKKCVVVTPSNGNAMIAKQIKMLGFKTIILWEEMQAFFCMKKIDLNKKNPELKAYLNKNEKFKGKYHGKRCFIIGTGPSIKEQNLLDLRDEIVFTVNNATKLKDFSALHSNFHVFIDSLYFDESGGIESVNERVNLMKKIGKVTECFFPYTKSHQFIKKYQLDKHLSINYLEEEPQYELGEDTIDFQKMVAAGG